LPGTLNSQTLDPVCGPQIRRDNEERAARNALSFSFGFGGSNCVLAFGNSPA
jgi:3-oxoacyl-[acyl-carrier-protein] synthase-1